MKTEEFITASEQEVAELFRKYVTPDRYPAFISTNAQDIRNIAQGKISGVLTLNNNSTLIEYRAKIHGIKRINTGQTSYIKFNCLYANKELKVSSRLTIGDGICVLTPEQETALKTEGRLNEVLKFIAPDGNTKERFVAVDKDLNRLSFVTVSSFKCPEKLLGVDLTPGQQKDLRQGRKIEITLPKGNKIPQPRQVWFDPTDHRVHIELQSPNQFKPFTPSEAPAKSPILAQATEQAQKNKGKTKQHSQNL